MFKKIIIFCMAINSLCAYAMDPEIQINSTIHETEIGSIGSFRTEAFVAFVNKKDGSVAKVIPSGGMQIPSDYNTRVSANGKRFFCELIDRSTKAINIAVSDTGTDSTTILPLPDKSKTGKSLNSNQFLWTTDPAGASIHILCEEQGNHKVWYLHLDLWSADGNQPSGYVPTLYSLQGGSPLAALMRANPSRIMPREYYEHFLQITKDVIPHDATHAK